jgi:hypothetical protein
LNAPPSVLAGEGGHGWLLVGGWLVVLSVVKLGEVQI